ncbi:MAG TPA: NAD(P)H-dependent oxidoreductase [Candidatus Saccharimonadales bacterium]|nr:NAD(P)H-dependent oxidoreductase [Candidatus Saccharimonadales bacterium]
MAKIGVIIGSIREGRVSDKLAKWVVSEVEKVADTELVDLKDYPLPLFSEAISPRYNPNRNPAPEVKKWLDKMASFDGYVIVTPEYNRALPGALKNAIDSLGNEVADKPAALVAHGSSGGAQAVASLRMVLPGVGIVSLPNALFFTDAVGDAINDEGIIKSELQEGPYSPQGQLANLATTLVKYADALKTVRG